VVIAITHFNHRQFFLLWAFVICYVMPIVIDTYGFFTLNFRTTFESINMWYVFRWHVSIIPLGKLVACWLGLKTRSTGARMP